MQPRMIVATLNGNHNETINSCKNLTNVSDETDLITFYNEPPSLVRSIPKHNVIIISGNMNAQIGKNVNNKFRLHNLSNRKTSNRFYSKTELTCFNTKFQKRKGKLWTYTYANNAKARIDYVLINKKWNYSALNCEAYSSFEGLNSGHRIVTAKIRLSLQRNAARTATTVHWDWSILKTKKQIRCTLGDIRNTYSERRIWEPRQSPHRSGSRMHTN